MALQIQTFDDLLHIIDTHPEWRRRLVKALFPEIDLPKALQELSESNRLWREELQVMRTRQGQTDERLGQVEICLERIDGRPPNGACSEVAQEGSSYENDICREADAIFGYLMYRGYDARNEMVACLDAAELTDQITGDEYYQVLASDLLWSGQLKGSNEPTTLVVEVSWWAEESDLERAVLRAAILQKLGLRAIPVVAAREWSDIARQEAQRRGVVIVEQFSVDRPSWNVESIQ